MKKFSPVLLAFLVLLMAAACKKEKGLNEEIDPNAVKPYDFMSTKNGSWWEYKSRTGTGYKRYARSLDTMKKGLKYSYFERQDTDTSSLNPEYYGKNNTLYITLIDLDGAHENYLECVYWHDSAHTGDSWSNTGTVYHPSTGNVQAKIVSTELEEGLTMTYGNHTFENVVHVQSILKGGLFNISLGKIDVWFAKGLGIIREEADINIMSVYMVQHTDSLVDYHIVP